MKVDTLMSKNQPKNWFRQITRECQNEYPIHLVDIDASEVCIDMGCNVGGFSEAWNYRFHNILAIDASSYNVEQYKSRHTHTVLQKAVSSEDGNIVKLKKYMCDGDDTTSGNFSITGFVYEHNQHGWGGDEYEEVTEANARIEGDVFNDPYYTDGIQVDEIIKEVDDKVPSIKYASGGLAYMLGE